ncbi:hypothetical protein GUF72_05155 [Xanthomonas citri pv. citri]|uniref:Uncharacterized protein n=3 Tax=Gammaproteobacteria TaxID=1236 RepID=A0A7U2L0S7_XANCI|nr:MULTISPECIES: hypothetical protein [Xanthomonas]AGH77994.1 hypothetical protein XAC29_12745 [Xanthomonas axonopodis Xac29-1]AGI07974.1 Hypothetical Protein XCAW_02185 [Xanthomonas citri subsp. citri Aw12879]AKM25541.1 hypothetical protein AB890_12725 [Xanthomonas citri pv. citri]APR10698.1 hypothetical protein BI314_11450 [Xanthomonas citri pv. citri]APR14054.1 hypothetical protein BI315_03465 [Xanthomonas citri pv. citri]
MDNIIPFPTWGKDALANALQVIRGHYATAGLSQSASDAAIEEITPIFKKYLGGKVDFAMDIPACGLSQDQIDLIANAHGKCVQEIFECHGQQLGLALCEIAGIVGAKYDT